MIPIQTSLTQLLGKEPSYHGKYLITILLLSGIQTPIVAATMAGASGGSAFVRSNNLHRIHFWSERGARRTSGIGRGVWFPFRRYFTRI